MSVIRAVDWRDLGLLARVRHRGLCLDSQLAFTRGANALQNALLDPFNPQHSISTLVARGGRSAGGSAIAQLLLLENHPLARLAFFGPPEALELPLGFEMLEALERFAGEHGAQSLIAEVDEQAPAFESLRAAGFAIYARQKLWRLDRSSAHQPAPNTPAWRHPSQQDHLAIQGLFRNLVPALVQQVEPPPGKEGQGLVHWAEGELLAFLDVHRGPAGTWILPYIHPAVESREELIAGALAGLSPSPSRPLYLCVRSYQGGLAAALEALGFQPYLDQAVMVKRLTARLREAALRPLPAMEGTQPEASAPITYNCVRHSAVSQKRGS